MPAARELGIGIVPYSPIGRGLLSGAVTSTDSAGRGRLPAQQPALDGREPGAQPGARAARARGAEQLGATPAQVAIAWLLAKGDDVVPIPGTKRLKYLEENVARRTSTLGADVIAELDSLGEAAGARYPEAMMGAVNN